MQQQPRPRSRPRVELELGCLVPLLALLAVAIAVGVFIGTRLQDGTEQRQQPREVVVNVKAGATVVSTQVVPLP
jgi:hypothetical protein